MLPPLASHSGAAGFLTAFSPSPTHRLGSFARAIAGLTLVSMVGLAAANRPGLSIFTLALAAAFILVTTGCITADKVSNRAPRPPSKALAPLGSRWPGAGIDQGQGVAHHLRDLR